MIAPNKTIAPTFIYRLCFWLAIIASVSANQTNANETTAPLSSNPFSAQSETFLSVDEAYQLSLRQTDTDIIAEWVIADTYFLYGEQFHFSIDGQTVNATRAAGEIAYDEIFEKAVEKYYTYTQSIINKTQINTKANPILLSIRYQGCADAGLCYPPEIKSFAIDSSTNKITPVTQAQLTSSIATEIPTLKTKEGTLFLDALMVLFALLGGVLLNLMPCVFPVLSLKALSLTNNTNTRSRIQHGWSYTLGCITTFIVVAGLLLVVRSAGKFVGWGFQLQEPIVISGLAFLFFIMGLSLSGVIHIGTRWMGTGQSLTQGGSLQHSFFTGVLAAVVASPCTAPFMASALGYALTQPSFTALSIFAALGLGMSLPFLALSYLPQLSRFLPAPGEWMDTFKQAIAFPLYITCAWLLWVLGNQVGNNGVILVILGAIGILFAIWLTTKQPRWRLSITLITCFLIGSILWHNKQPSINTSEWQTYKPDTLNALRQEGAAVFVNLTADWCITCKINEKLVFTPETLALMKDKNIHLLEGDWTNYNPDITELLDRYGRGGVPLYLLFPAKPNSAAIILPQILRPSAFRKLINEF
jgi:thiol:disulfide interchange protein